MPLLIGFLLLITLIPLALYRSSQVPEAEAAWWNPSWQYRKRIDVTNLNSTDLTEFQISITIDTASLIVDGKMQSDCDDIRITNHQGKLLPYWVDQASAYSCNTTDTKLWVKTPKIPLTGATIFVYYGNASAPKDVYHDGAKTFIAFQEFSNSASVEDAGFSIITGDWSIENEMLKVTQGVANDPSVIWESAGNEFGDFVLEWDAKTTDSSYPSGSYQGARANVLLSSSRAHDGAAARVLWHPTYTPEPGAFRYEGCVSQSNTNMGFVPHLGQMYHQVLAVSATNNLASFSMSDVPFGGADSFSVSKTGSSCRSAGFVGVSSTRSTNYWDRLYIRKYASSAPSTSLAAEETGPGPVAYWKFDEGSGSTAFDSANYGLGDELLADGDMEAADTSAWNAGNGAVLSRTHFKIRSMHHRIMATRQNAL